MSNPVTRSGMVFYPDDTDGRLGEVWHGDKMLRDIPNHLLTPTIRHKGVVYYVDELVKMEGDRWFVPLRWVTRDAGKVMCAVGHHVFDSPVRIVISMLPL